MKRQTLWKWSLGVSSTIFLLAGTSLQTAAEPSKPAGGPSPILAAQQPAPMEVVAEEGVPAAPDTDAAAKLVSEDKPLPANIKPGGPIAEVVKLANSGLDASVMLAFVTNSTRAFNLGAEEIIYLNDIGIPGGVVTAMLQHDQTLKTSLAVSAGGAPAAQEPPAPQTAPAQNLQLSVNGPTPEQVAPQPGEGSAPYAAEAPLTPPDPGSDEMFYDSLSPYGNWVDVDGYGRCWQPTTVVVNPGWQPYFDCGHWVYSDCGWYWRSDYSWGWAPFHYGSWFRHGHLGWCWVPGRVWGPSWVSWRYTDHCCGWAPLPPGTRFTAGVGLTFHGHRVGERDDLGLRPGHYHFVGWDHFHDRQLRPGSLPPQQVARVYATSTVATRISGDDRTIINNGLPVSRVAAATHRPIHTVALRDSSEPVGGGRAERIEASGHTLAVYRPDPYLSSRLPSHEQGGGLPGAIKPSSTQSAPGAPRGGNGNTHRSSDDSRNDGRLATGQAAPLILKGPQSSALKESPPAHSLVVTGRGQGNQAPASSQSWSAAPAPTRPNPNSSDANARTASTLPALSAPAQNAVSRPAANQIQQRNWMGTVSVSPQPSWFAGTEGTVPSAAAPRPDVRGYQAGPRTDFTTAQRYAPPQNYVPQRSYSPPPMSVPVRSPSFEARPAPSAPPAPSARSAPSYSPPSRSSDKNGR